MDLGERVAVPAKRHDDSDSAVSGFPPSSRASSPDPDASQGPVVIGWSFKDKDGKLQLQYTEDQ
ncbi:uncharacterized protein RHO25_007582 [Cercospora beticola]|uniref:Uncharacterized protein n=1 Tax=Cercospora beticola TaxID=122368 RepID=A0ABZ0NTW7_CERBT|nr:hypothetical protein RHO25_007582 [Cercospora beticola]CAK1358354.1 unnamed protein product [Cercospora beticola]